VGVERKNKRSEKLFLKARVFRKTQPNQINAHPQPITGFSNWCTPGCWVTVAPELNTTTGNIKFTGQTK
jgi:hypothetical protein